MSNEYNEPWKRIDEDEVRYEILDNINSRVVSTIASCYYDDAVNASNLDRITRCVNLLAGIPDETIDSVMRRGPIKALAWAVLFDDDSVAAAAMVDAIKGGELDEFFTKTGYRLPREGDTVFLKNDVTKYTVTKVSNICAKENIKITLIYEDDDSLENKTLYNTRLDRIEKIVPKDK